MLPEITRPVDLCLPSGALNPAATGWTRTPLHRTNLHPAPLGSRAATWSRTRRREHWTIVTDSHLIALTVNSHNYAAQHQVWVYDRQLGAATDGGDEAVTDTVIEQNAIVPLARQVEFPETSGSGPVRALTRDLAIAVDPEGAVTRLRAKTPRVRLELHVETGGESLGVVIPWTDRLFQYISKSAALPVTGRLQIDEEDIDIGEFALASFDNGRGRWPYATNYTSASGSGWVDGVRTGLHLGGGWSEGTGASENALITDGVVHYLPQDVTWDYDTECPIRPWLIEGDGLWAELTPWHHGTSSTNLGIVATTTTQVCGVWHGWVQDDDGQRHSLDGIVGWAEQTSNRW